MRPGRSLGFQLLSRSLLILAGLLVLIGLLQYVLMKDALFRSSAEALAGQLRSLPIDLLVRGGIGRGIGDGGGGEGEGGITGGDPGGRRPRIIMPDASLAFVGNGIVFETERENGKPSPKLTRAQYQDVFQELRTRRKGPVYRVARDGTGTEQLLVFRLPPGDQIAPGHSLFQMGTPTEPLRATLVRQLLIFAVLSLLALAGGLALYLPVLRRTLLPLNRIVDTVRRVDAGRLDERLPAAQGQLETDRLAESFNGMLERLGASFEAEREAKEKMRRFIADASHELRTPLTSIHGFLEVLQRGAADRPEQLHAALASMHGESSRMKKLVEDLLLLAKLDRTPQLQLAESSLDAIVRGMEPQLRLLAGPRSVRFELEPGLVGMYDPDKIKQIVLNLFQNAVQHTDAAGGEIGVRTSREGDSAMLAVTDNGTGIPPEHLPHVFDRFYRIDASRTRAHGGAGLGLSITRSLAEAHGGSIAVTREPGAGAAFMVRLPLGGA